MAIFNCYVSSPEGKCLYYFTLLPLNDTFRVLKFELVPWGGLTAKMAWYVKRWADI